MINRRKFLQQSGTLAAAGMVMPALGRAAGLFNRKITTPIGLQLYTLGGLMTSDAKGTLQKLAAIGYKELESAGSGPGTVYGIKVKEFAAMVKDLGMTWRSEHVGGVQFTMAHLMKMAKTAEDSAKFSKMAPMIEKMPKFSLKDNAQQVADDAAEGGLSYVVCSSIPVSNMDEIKQAVDVFNKAGEACKKNGVQFAYHNHVTEFDTIEGHRPFDYILNNTDEHLVKMELDLAWATKAKQDPIELFKLHPGRYPLWHVKDLDKVKMEPAEVGTGVVDFKRIFDNAKESGMKYFFVEQDGAPQPLANVANSYNYLNNMFKG